MYLNVQEAATLYLRNTLRTTDGHSFFERNVHIQAKVVFGDTRHAVEHSIHIRQSLEADFILQLFKLMILPRVNESFYF